MRLAVVLSHPTQYYSPWFRQLTMQPWCDLKVFYLWDFGVTEQEDRTFKSAFAWDIPLLDGYAFEFIPNRSKSPGTHWSGGLDNPTLVSHIKAWQPAAILMFGYTYRTHLRLIFAPSLARVPLLFRGDSHDIARAGGWRSACMRMVRRLLFKRFRAFLAVGQANKTYFLNHGIPAGRIAFCPHCVDNERFQSQQEQALSDGAAWRLELGIPSGSFVFLFAGKFESKKRPLDLLAAFLEMATTNPSLEGKVWLLLVGSGELEVAMQAFVREHHLTNVTFAPFQNQTKMPRTYASGDVLVLPSYGNGETWGLAINEAMNLHRPAIVSSHVGCAADLVIPGQTGWVFEAGSVASLAESMAQAALDPPRTTAMGDAAAGHINHYSYETATAALAKVLRDNLLLSPTEVPV
jgi:glycosyltransferase involved in cell wall biosynthesis